MRTMLDDAKVVNHICPYDNSKLLTHSYVDGFLFDATILVCSICSKKFQVFHPVLCANIIEEIKD